MHGFTTRGRRRLALPRATSKSSSCFAAASSYLLLPFKKTNNKTPPLSLGPHNQLDTMPRSLSKPLPQLPPSHNSHTARQGKQESLLRSSSPPPLPHPLACSSSHHALDPTSTNITALRRPLGLPAGVYFPPFLAQRCLAGIPSNANSLCLRRLHAA